MGYVEGPTLGEVIARTGALPLGAVRLLFEQTCDAVAAPHECPIIHRNIKPANMLHRAEGDVVLTDFGLACARRVPPGGSRVEVLAGSPAYTAPEMFDMVISPRTDVYALGVVLIEMLTGSVPCEGDFETVRRCHREQDMPVERLPETFAPLREVIRRATARNPLFRTRSARHLLESFREAVGRMDSPEPGARAGWRRPLAARHACCSCGTRPTRASTRPRPARR
jgi:serine/threonine protein kinase